MYHFFKRNLSKKRLRRLLKPAWLYFILKKLHPISPRYGKERGSSIDRYYIEKFLEGNSNLITGHCLEVEDNHYTSLFGKQIIKSDVLDINPQNAQANLRADLRNMPQIADNTYDTVILTQVLLYIDDYESAIRECRRILKPDGTLLVIVPAMCRIDVRAGVDGDYWRFTKASANYVFGKYFKKDKLEVKTWGNVLAGLGFWTGLAQEDFSKKELDYQDENFPVLVTIKATK
ncbi:MAG: class I SAM-dependent methyltransferase [bacterium]|nr:class I SAM-dependent methyltransferase [bacterium]